MQEDLQHGRQLQQFLPPLPIVVPLPPFLTGGGGLFSGSGSGSGSGSSEQHQHSTSLQSNSAANGNCTASWAGDLLFHPATANSSPVFAAKRSQSDVQLSYSSRGDTVQHTGHAEAGVSSAQRAN